MRGSPRDSRNLRGRVVAEHLGSVNNNTVGPALSQYVARGSSRTVGPNGRTEHICRPVRKSGLMRLIAHRGFDEQYSANTVAAVEQAVPEADMVELDVHRCKSGELVVAHNALVDIDIDGVDRVDELTASELAALDAHNSEGVQTLETVLNPIPSEVGVNLELKAPDITKQALAMAESIPHEVIISSFDPDPLRGICPRQSSNVELAYVLGATLDDDLTVATDLGCEFVHPHAWLCLLTGVVADAHDAGLVVNAWTVDSRLGAWMLSWRGVDGLIASSPRVTEWLE